MIQWIVPLTDAVVTFFIMVIGGNLGSFLNVVVYRLPRGESVVHGGSHCPACGAAIRWYDNVPVFGWLFLGGRCRDCHVPIAARYPLLEAAGGLVIGGVVAYELLSGGRTLPGPRFGNGRPGADNLLLRPEPLLIGVGMLHAWLLFNLLLGAAVEADGREVPKRWWWGCLVASLVVVVVLPELLPLGVWSPLPSWLETGPLRGILISLTGLAMGWVLGLGWHFSPATRQGLLLVGTMLGWQAVAAVAWLMPVCAEGRRAIGSLIPPVPPPVDPSPPLPPLGPELNGEGIVVAGADQAELPGIPAALGRLWEPCPAWLRAAGSTAGDLVLATTIHLVVWRWEVGLFSRLIG